MDDFYYETIRELEEMGIHDYIDLEIVDEMGMTYTIVKGFTDDVPEEIKDKYLLLCADYGIDPPWVGDQDLIIPPLV